MAPRRPRSPDSAVLGHWPAAVPRPAGPPSPPAPSASRTSTHSATPQPRRRIQSSRPHPSPPECSPAARIGSVPLPAPATPWRLRPWLSVPAHRRPATARPAARPAASSSHGWRCLTRPARSPPQNRKTGSWPPRRFFRPRPPAPAHRAEPPVPPGYTGGAGAARLCSSSPPSASRSAGKSLSCRRPYRPAAHSPAAGPAHPDSSTRVARWATAPEGLLLERGHSRHLPALRESACAP